jgi:hypothetical protein
LAIVAIPAGIPPEIAQEIECVLREDNGIDSINDSGIHLIHAVKISVPSWLVLEDSFVSKMPIRREPSLGLVPAPIRNITY